MRVLLIETRDELAKQLVAKLAASASITACHRAQADDLDKEPRPDVVVLSPYHLSSRHGDGPDLKASETALAWCAKHDVPRVVLISSACVYGPHHHNPGLMRETRELTQRSGNSISRRWQEFEATAQRLLPDGAKLTTLRPAWTLVSGCDDFPVRLFRRALATPLLGYDPPLQILSPGDLTDAVVRSIECYEAGVYNIAPTTVMPTTRAIRLSRSRVLPLPRAVQSLGRRILRLVGCGYLTAQIDFLRNNWTASADKIKDELGFVPRFSTAAAIAHFRGDEADDDSRSYDDFGFDPDSLRQIEPALNFVRKRYWRVECRGIEYVPSKGRAILAGIHRGFMPFDGKMVFETIRQQRGRVPRFMIHPGLVRFPFLATLYMKRLGAIAACRENANHVLDRDGLLALFPEGIRGAFRKYDSTIYQLGKFGRNDFVKFALQHSAPILPFVTLGPAESFPILARIEWSWWKRVSEWPYFPITPTWPLLPISLPTKWHIEFLPPIEVAHYGSAAANDREVVAAISNEVRTAMQNALDDLVARRKSVFFGNLFNDSPTPELQKQVA